MAYKNLNSYYADRRTRLVVEVLYQPDRKSVSRTARVLIVS
jgi:hypothetical protein